MILLAGCQTVPASVADAKHSPTGVAIYQPTPTSVETPTATIGPTMTPHTTATPDSRATVIGASVQSRPIVVYRLGRGPQPVVLIGGIHGGYEWNTVLLAYRFIDYLYANPALIPSGFTLYVIPSANPDGVFAVTRREGRFAPGDVAGDTSIGRLNANGVDLNRNWACNWQPTAEWGSQTVSAGSQRFSEPETRALRDFIQGIKPRAVVLWHSAAGGVFPGGCGRDSAFEASKSLARLYAESAGYTGKRGTEGGTGRFTAYPVTGDAANWITRQGIPALVVELNTHDQIEFDQNWRGVQAILAALEQ